MMLTELLVALMIVSLIGVSLTVGVNGAAKVYRDATRLYEAETLCGTILTCLEDEFRFARNIQYGGVDNTVTAYDSLTFGNSVSVVVDGADNKGKIHIGSGTNSALLGDGAYTSGLVAAQPVIKRLEDAHGQVSIEITVKVTSDMTHAAVEHTVTVFPLNQ